MDRSSNAVNGAPAIPPSRSQSNPRPTPARKSSTSSMRRQDLSQSTRHPSQPALSAQTSFAATSSNPSPFASRESSPARPSARSHNSLKTPTAAAATASDYPATTPRSPPLAPTAPASRNASAGSTTRSRRNSQQDPSPSRVNRSGIPTLAAQKAGTLSASTTPALPPALPSSDASATTRTAGPQKSEFPRDAPRWPVSPRLRSPPPVLNRPNASVPDATSLPPPAINQQRETSHAPESLSAPSDSEAEELYLQPGMRTPVRGASGNVPTLETVQEASPLAPSSSRALDTLEKFEVSSVASDTDAGAFTTPEVAEVSPVKSIRAKLAAAAPNQTTSGSENGGTKSNRRQTTATASTTSQPSLISRQSGSSKATGKAKSGEGSQPTMTVETETVTSIPNVDLGPAAVQGVNGSLRTKLSSETIRPKKDRKKPARKLAAVTPGATTSKADIFEAKVASAVDEANTSDSEETFVYDSNPADSRERPRRFHHSRTPSATSLANDRNGMRSIHSILEGGGPSVTVKKNMKFVNTFGNSSGNDNGVGDDESMVATVRGGTPGSGRGTARLHHGGGGGSHIGRWGLGGPKNGHQSILDGESPFYTNTATRLNLPFGTTSSGGHGSANGNGRQPGVTSPTRGGTVPFSRRGGTVPMTYDLDDTTSGVVDDERTPLIAASLRGTGRISNRARRHHTSLRSLEQQSYHRHPTASVLNRFASCLVLAVMLILVVAGAIGFMFATSQPLEDIELVKISGVIASEQELMFDLMVRAHNPNAVLVTVESADMEVFAKSPHAGTDSEWWRRPHGGRKGVDEGTETDPVTESETELVTTEADAEQPTTSPNFLLGKFTEFDNPLSFEGSFFHHGLSTSRSGVRIRRPGNGTDGGSERWERILEDEFDLIIKGVLRYSLPLSQRVRSALIEGRTTVTPNAANDPSHRLPNGTASISDEE